MYVFDIPGSSLKLPILEDYIRLIQKDIEGAKLQYEEYNRAATIESVKIDMLKRELERVHTCIKLAPGDNGKHM